MDNPSYLLKIAINFTLGIVVLLILPKITFSANAKDGSVKLYISGTQISYDQTKGNQSYSGIFITPRLDFDIYKTTRVKMNVSMFYSAYTMSSSTTEKVSHYGGGGSLQYNLTKRRNAKFKPSIGIGMSYKKLSASSLGYNGIISPMALISNKFRHKSRRHSEFIIYFATIGSGFSMDNYSLGLDMSYPLTKKQNIRLNGGYSQTTYSTTTSPGVSEGFNESNIYLGLGFEF